MVASTARDHYLFPSTSVRVTILRPEPTEVGLSSIVPLSMASAIQGVFSNEILTRQASFGLSSVSLGSNPLEWPPQINVDTSSAV